MSYQPANIPAYLVKDIESALEAGLRVHEDAEWVRATIGDGITEEAFDHALRQSGIGSVRLRAAFEEVVMYKRGVIIMNDPEWQPR